MVVIKKGEHGAILFSDDLIFSIPACFAASNSLCVIIPSKIKYLIPDWPLIFWTNSLIATLKISFSSESSAIASNDSLRLENRSLQILANGLSLSLLNDGASNSFSIFFAIGLSN